MRFSFFIAVFIAFSPNLSKAIDVQNSSSVTIMQDLSLTQQTELNFGKVLIPASGTHLVRVKNNGDYHETTTGTIGNSQTHGRFYVTGEPNATIKYTKIAVSSSIPGVTFDRIYLTSSQTIPGDGDRYVNVGGRIYVDSTAQSGVYNNGELSYTFSAEYE